MASNDPGRIENVVIRPDPKGHFLLFPNTEDQAAGISMPVDPPLNETNASDENNEGSLSPASSYGSGGVNDRYTPYNEEQVEKEGPQGIFGADLVVECWQRGCGQKFEGWRQVGMMLRTHLKSDHQHKKSDREIDLEMLEHARGYRKPRIKCPLCGSKTFTTPRWQDEMRKHFREDHVEKETIYGREPDTWPPALQEEYHQLCLSITHGEACGVIACHAPESDCTASFTGYEQKLLWLGHMKKYHRKLLEDAPNLEVLRTYPLAPLLGGDMVQQTTYPFLRRTLPSWNPEA
ncbi:hypothetical protein BJ508DRAFT_304096 [Ascobolus immersus RN42]|uniref:Uncharacterized protein n=1 Tax=Ascobolus immersus RN42 TaxID=1160509 RepID=A0A3N4IDQ7_ASCIM|nr:hypothetical protein BJ508DRAFT_304096 [Ascobolus immersus RN42]